MAADFYSQKMSFWWWIPLLKLYGWTINYRVGSQFLRNLPSLNIPLPENSPFYKDWIADLENHGIFLLSKYDIGWCELTAAARRCPLPEEPTNKKILVLAHQGSVAWSHHIRKKALRLIWPPHMNIEIADNKGFKPKRSSTVGEGDYSGCLAGFGIPNHREPVRQFAVGYWATLPRNSWSGYQ